MGDWRSQEDPPRAQRHRKWGGNHGDPGGAHSTGGKKGSSHGSQHLARTSELIKSTCPQANVISLAGRVEGLLRENGEREVKVAA